MTGQFLPEVETWARLVDWPLMNYVGVRSVTLEVMCDRCGMVETYEVAFPGKEISLLARQLPKEKELEREKADVSAYIPHSGIPPFR